MQAIAVAELLTLTQEHLTVLLTLIIQALEDQRVMILTTDLLTRALATTVREVQAQTIRLKGTLTLVHRRVDHRETPIALRAMTTEALHPTHRRATVAVTLATVQVHEEVAAAALRPVLVVQAQVVALQEDQDNFLNKTHFYTPLINQLLLAGIFLSFF